MNNFTEAEASYERCLLYEDTPFDIQRVNSRLATIYLQHKKVKIVLDFFF